MKQTETRRLRSDLTDEQKAEALRIGSLDYRSHRKMDRRVEKFISNKDHH